MTFEFRRDTNGKPLWHAALPGGGDPYVIGPCQLCAEPWPCAEARYDAGPIAVTGVWLRNGPERDHLEVLVEIDGKWRTVIEERCGDLISHTVEPLGMRHAKGDRLEET